MYQNVNMVTILILIDGFLQLHQEWVTDVVLNCHNPYFNRWFSAISKRGFSYYNRLNRHNPYFNRWFSAI